MSRATSVSSRAADEPRGRTAFDAMRPDAEVAVKASRDERTHDADGYIADQAGARTPGRFC
jgi:hypothetical protein